MSPAPAVWTVSRKTSNRLCHALNGNTSGFESELKDILLQKGVPGPVVNDRVKNAIKTLGAKTLQLEFDKKDSLQGLWNRLKAAATRQNFRWITREELNSARKPKEAFKRQVGGAKSEDPWMAGQDPWSQSHGQSSSKHGNQSYDVLESFVDTDGNEVCRLDTADLKPGAIGYALVDPSEVSSIITVFRAAGQVEPCLALSPSAVPGVQSVRENMLVRNSADDKLLQVRVHMFQLGGETVSLKRDKVIQVPTAETVALVMYAHMSRMNTEHWQSCLKAPRAFLQQVLTKVSVVDSWHRPVNPSVRRLAVCFRVPLDQLSQVLVRSGTNGVSFGFYKSDRDPITQKASEGYDIIPLDPSKSLEQVRSLAARLPGEPNLSFTESKLSLLVRKTQYVACIQSIEPSFLPHGVRQFPVAAVKVLKGFDTVADESTVHQLARSEGWKVHVEATWVYRDAFARKRAFKVAFDEAPLEDHIMTSQGYILLENPTSRVQRKATESQSTMQAPSWRWASEVSTTGTLESTLRAVVDDRLAAYEARSDGRIQDVLVKVDDALVACRQNVENQKAIATTVEAFRSDQGAVNQQVLRQFHEVSLEMRTLQDRQDHAEASFRERLESLRSSQEAGLQELSRMVEEKRPRHS